MFKPVRVPVSAGKIEVIVEYDRQTATKIRKLNAYSPKAAINWVKDVYSGLISVKAPIERARPKIRSENASILGRGFKVAERSSFMFIGYVHVV